MVDIHVGQPGGLVVTAGQDLVVGDRRHGLELPDRADGGETGRERPAEVVVDPVVAPAGFRVALVVVVDEVHFAAGIPVQIAVMALDPRPSVPVFRRQPVLPEILGFDNVIVHRDDAREFRHHSSPLGSLTPD
jgi:hypothetical protein